MSFDVKLSSEVSQAQNKGNFSGEYPPKTLTLAGGDSERSSAGSPPAPRVYNLNRDFSGLDIYSISRRNSHFVTFKIHKKSVEIVMNHGTIRAGKPSQNLRKEVTNFSYKSKRNMRLILEDTSELWKVWVVLTYPFEFPFDGRKVKRDIDVLNHWLKRKNIKNYFWGLEFQKRGAPHINVLLPCRVDISRLSKAWYKIVGSGDTKHLKSGVDIQKITEKDGKLDTYLIGYNLKKSQKDVPENFKNVGRFWGCSRFLNPSGSFTYRFNSTKALIDFILPIEEYYKAKIDKWYEGKKKPYRRDWKLKAESFIFWDGTEFIENFIINKEVKS